MTVKILKLNVVFLFVFGYIISVSAQQHQHDHNHAGHDHSHTTQTVQQKVGEKAAEVKADLQKVGQAKTQIQNQIQKTKEGHDHSGHSHDGHDHSGHDHSGHDHSGHDHSGHSHNGHDHSGHSHSNQHAGHDHGDHGHAHGDHGDHHGPNACGFSDPHHGKFDPAAVAFHHISDQNIYSIGPWHFPLPVISWVPKKGFDIFSSGRFDADAHGNALTAYNGYVLFEGAIRRISDASFPQGEVKLAPHSVYAKTEKDAKGKDRDIIHLCHGGKEWRCENKSTLDGGLFGGGLTSFHDLSITKNVLSMFLMFLFGFFLFGKVKRSYVNRQGMAPTGLQGFIEPIFMFIQDEVCKPFIGPKWEKFVPFLMSIFFFILLLNLFGQIPFFGGSNVTGSLSVTMVLALFAFLVTNLNGNKHYWEHIFWMPGVPAWVKTILTPVEVLGAFIIKPLTLMLRLFANITAGHMVIVIFVSLIFVFSKNGLSPVGGYGTVIPSALLSVFMMAIELLVAFIQAFVFTILTASYIGAAVEEVHH